MRAETHELQLSVIWLTVNQHQIRPDMAIPVVFPATGQRMVKMPLGQRLVIRQAAMMTGKSLSSVCRCGPLASRL